MPRLAILAALALLLPASAAAQKQDSDHIDPAAVLKVCKPENPPPCATEPKVLEQPDPEYSADALKHKIKGHVSVAFVVGRDGRAHDIRVTKSLGHGLDEEAIAALKRWRFSPGTYKGVPVPVALAADFTFSFY